ncbi:MAG: hypothetical protein ACFE8L_12210 [Candidatus Hodarchaeota archaeon]
MTHSLHRTGNVEDLKRDYIILAMLAAGINDKYPDSRKKLIKIGEILNQHNPTNIMPKELWKVSPVGTAAFTDRKTVEKIIKTLKEEDLGISIVISGLLNEIQNITSKADLNLHTVHLSLGIFGKKELLPSEEILEISTMCGHHCVSSSSIEYYANLIRDGKISVDDGAKKLAKPCVCGIFNLSRAIKILNTLAKE